MSDRFDFLEIGDARPAVTMEPDNAAPLGSSGPGWKPLRLRAIEVIGEAGTEAGQFAAPLGIAVDRDGALYVVDSNNHRVQRIALNGDVRVYGRPGNMPGQLWGPQSIAVHPGGQFFFVSEQGNNRVQCFHFSGQSRGTLPGFRSPTGVTFDAEGHLWVADTGNARVVRCDINTGQILGGMDRSAGIARPLQVACDAARNVYVADGATGNVLRFPNFGDQARPTGPFRTLSNPQQIAIESGENQGRVYIAEAGANRLHVLDNTGGSLITMDTPMTKLGPFRSPSGVALGPSGEIYVADTLNNRILRLAWD